MEALVRIAQLLLSLSILVILHEFGHFAFAKIFKTRVEKFYLFFNPWFSIFKIKYGETEYGMGWLPLGGYVKISGMIDESMDKEQMKKPPQPYEFRSKPAWQRLLIMLGGVLVNFLLAVVIFIITLYIWGEEYLPNDNVKYGIVCDAAASEAGLQNGDKILYLEDQKIDNFGTILSKIILDDARKLTIDRNGEIMDIYIHDTIFPKIIQGQGFVTFRIPFIISEFSKGSAGKKAGLKKEDKIIAINGIRTEFFDEFRNELKGKENQTIQVMVLRDNEELTYDILLGEDGMIGARPGYLSEIFEYEKVKYSFAQAIPAGVKKGYKLGGDYLKQFKLIFNPETKAYESLGGFITIGKIFPGVWDWQAFWFLTAFLSIMLAILNILPIPALDGGHVMFLLYEMVSGRKASEKVLEYAQIVGMVLLFALLIYANGNDIVKLFK